MHPFILAVALLSTPADAYVYAGNPKITIEVTRAEDDLTSADVWLESVKVHACDGSTPTVVTVDAATDLTQPWSTTIAGGDLCGVSVRYDSALTIDTASWSVEHDEPKTQVVFNGWDPVTVPLTPFTVQSGTFSGNPPALILTLEP